MSIIIVVGAEITFSNSASFLSLVMSSLTTFLNSSFIIFITFDIFFEPLSAIGDEKYSTRHPLSVSILLSLGGRLTFLFFTFLALRVTAITFISLNIKNMDTTTISSAISVFKNSFIP